MSRPRHYWYVIVKKMIEEYPYRERKLQAKLYEEAIEEALEETKKLPNGELRLKVINGVLFNKSLTCGGAAQSVGYEIHTIQKWISSFIHIVGRKVGY